jgi:hypothetical protein
MQKGVQRVTKGINKGRNVCGKGDTGVNRVEREESSKHQIEHSRTGNEDTGTTELGLLLVGVVVVVRVGVLMSLR